MPDPADRQAFAERNRRQPSPRAPDVSPSRLLWCVRGVRYLDGLSRAAELTTRPLGAEMVAFLAETMPGSLMRGVPAADLAAAGLDDAAARAHADANTQARFASLPERIRAADRIPADGWRLGSDSLFQGSVLLVAEVLAAFAERSGGDVLLALPIAPRCSPSLPGYPARTASGCVWCGPGGRR